MLALLALLFFVQFGNEDLNLYKNFSTKRKLHIEHKEHKNSECPHVNLEAINIIAVDFRRHVMFGS